MALQRLLSFTSPTIHHNSFSHSLPLHSQSIHFSAPSSFNLLPLSLPRSPITLTSLQQTLETAPDKQEQEEFSRTRLLAQNLPWSSTTEDIRSLFEKHGQVIEVELSMYNKNRNRGLAFVEMGSPEDALAALNSLQSSEFEGRVIRIDYARPKKEKTPPPVKSKKPLTFNLFVANLSYEARSKDLKEFFDAGSGKVVSAEIVFNENPRKSSGYGFVAFKTKKEADAALIEFQGKEFMGRPLRVAKGRRFVQPVVKSASATTEETSDETTSAELSASATSEETTEDTSSELSVNATEADKAD